MQRAILPFRGAILKRPVQSQLPPIKIDRHSEKLLSAQVREAVRSAILDALVRPGCSLPSTRRLAAALGVSRNTVLKAYEQLWVEGLVLARSGSGTRVNPHVRASRQKPEPKVANLKEMLRESRYPFRAKHLVDPDGNSLILRY